jgi:hypothetical protein
LPSARLDGRTASPAWLDRRASALGVFGCFGLRKLVLACPIRSLELWFGKALLGAGAVIGAALFASMASLAAERAWVSASAIRAQSPSPPSTQQCGRDRPIGASDQWPRHGRRLTLKNPHPTKKPEKQATPQVRRGGTLCCVQRSYDM